MKLIILFGTDRTVENSRHKVEVRDAKINEIVSTAAWIIEGVHYSWTIESFRQADFIFLIKPNKFVRDIRIILRFIRTRLGIEQSNYKQSYRNLYDMLFIWNKEFDKDNIKEIMEITEEYSVKRILVKDNKEITKYIHDYLNTQR
ncbi:hypothetical protein J2T13_002060 [Paenibacillus sp. DS2015]|uniref:hypothetical protein n=1 Tax=Paenibacillus sp. DS2015 TaxID=3373917 RepID=UPI003D1A7DF8